MMVTVDPGKHASGWAAFKNGELVLCGYTGSAKTLVATLYPIFQNPRLVVVEAPRVYDRRRWKGDPNDLIDISIAGGILVGALRPEEIKIIRPQDWKGQTPKDIQAERTLAKLTEAERLQLEGVTTKSKLHNVIDAVGIGLWELKRCQTS